MRLWFAGPRMLGGLIRPGVSFGPEDLRWLRGRAQPSAQTGVRRAPSFVYVIKGATDHVKIGISANPLARLANLQTASSTPLELCYTAAACSGDCLAIEQLAHRTLDRHRKSGEWFAVAPEMAVAAIAAASHRLNDPIVALSPTQVATVLREAADEDQQGARAMRPRRHWALIAFVYACCAAFGVAVAFFIWLLQQMH